MREDGDIEDAQTSHSPFQMRLPGFVNDENMGLGDVVKRVSYAFGIAPCGGCERRAAALNRWVVIAGRGR
jgi:hypothetical protein